MSFSYISLKIVTVYLIVFSPGILLSILTFWAGRVEIALCLLIPSLFAMYLIIRLLVLRRIIIDEKGVVFKTPSTKQQIMWSDIKSIGVSDRRDRAGIKWIYFTSQKVPPLLYVEAKMISNGFFAVSYRKSIIKAVRQYWHSEIDGI